MYRRVILRAFGIAGAAGVLAACGTSRSAAPAPTVPTPTPTGRDLIGLVAPGARESLQVIAASAEQLTGRQQPFAFGVLAEANEPLRDADLRVHVIPTRRDPVGPYEVEFRDVEAIALGLYLTRVDLTEPVPTAFVVTTADGTQAGLVPLQVVTPEGSAFPAPGRPAPAAATPTTTDQLGFAALCTQQPACGMHEVSLDAALAEGRPVMITFATPAFCETAVCGPSVGVAETVRGSRDWGDIAWIHCEVFTDRGETLAPPVQAWNLPTEPWMFAIDRGGIVAARADGPLLSLQDQVAALAERIA